MSIAHKTARPLDFERGERHIQLDWLFFQACPTHVFYSCCYAFQPFLAEDSSFRLRSPPPNLVDDDEEVPALIDDDEESPPPLIRDTALWIRAKL
ncbi:hypothetical protein B0H13DRAFT_2343088 [Mycena leptocephala]|nr:hypothetical protein B0H13DRAFT_2343088 [Mycena leptocephala]